jgi:hypothetical protein
MLRPAYLRQKLTRPLPTKDGGVLWTVADARAYMLALSQERALRQHWQNACRILDQADVAAFKPKGRACAFPRPQA